MKTHPLRLIRITQHQLPLNYLQETSQSKPQLYNAPYYVARGSLLGFFYTPVPLLPEDQLTFVGDFSGFFEQQKPAVYEVKSETKEVYFQGIIQALEVFVINGEKYDHRKAQLYGNSFRGLFKGVITQYQEQRWFGFDKFNIQHLIREGILEVKEKRKIIVPAFTRFTLKNINSVKLEQARAFLSGNLIIDIQLTHNLMQHIEQYDPKAFISLALNRENALRLPINRKGHIKQGQNDIVYEFKEKTATMRYSIRKIFQAEIQSSYKQFFTPFNEIYLKIVVTFLDLKVRYPLNVRVNEQELALRNGRESSSPKLGGGYRIKKKGGFNQLQINFLCLDLEDYIQPNDPYVSFNKLCQYPEGSQDLIMNRMTKVHFLRQIESGDFRVATNNLASFPYYRQSLINSTRRNDSPYWNLGLEPRNKDIVDPQVRSIQEQYNQMLMDDTRKGKPLFQPLDWHHLHIEVPIYKYWVIYLIQICWPLVILAAISMFIFLQENGKDQDSFTNPLSYRIANVTGILLAYAALIPIFKDTTSRATNLSLFYIVIYLSVVPLILVLIRSLMDTQKDNSQFLASYKPFEDPIFLACFIYLLVLIFVMTLVVMIVCCTSLSQHEVNYRPRHVTFKKFSDAKEPQGFIRFIEQTNAKRGSQYQYSVVRELDDFGNVIPELMTINLI